MVDPIADMLTRIRNAQAVEHQTVDIPFSKIKMALAELLEKNNWIAKAEAKGKKINKYIEMTLKYEDGQPAISNLKRISKCGCRIYIKKDEIKPIRQGYGMTILSTSKGLMTGMEARKKGLGGEVICQIY
jgi:small subunit ribosomal protein S8